MRLPALTAAAVTTALAAALLIPGAGVASIPPSYRIVVVSADVQARARADALIQYMSAQDAFSRAEPTVWRHTFEPCLTATTPWETCAPAKLPLQAHWQDPPHVVIRVEAESREVLTLTCIRAGTETVGPARHARVDALTAIFGEGEARTAALRAAMDCIGGE